MRHGAPEQARQYDGAAALILSGAQLDLRDSGGASVMDIAEGKNPSRVRAEGLPGEFGGLPECGATGTVAE